MDLAFFKKVIDQVYRKIFYLNLYFQGEPYLNPEFFEMVKYAREKRIYVNTSTNGHFLDPGNARLTVQSGLNRIIVSLDGTDQESYSTYRIGGTFEKVTEGIKNLVAARSELGRTNPRIIIQFLVLRPNEQQIPEIKKLVKELGANRLELKSAQFYDFENGNPLMPADGEYSRYRQQVNRSTGQKVNGSLGHLVTGSPSHRIKNPLPNHCYRMWSSCVVTWDGFVAPCCFDKDVAYPMGSLKDHSFREIWKSEEYNLFRKKILSDRKSIDICRNCSEGIGISSLI
jgi:radical SAM protein with 4Fe4S-binding SPASM domain